MLLLPFFFLSPILPLFVCLFVSFFLSFFLPSFLSFFLLFVVHSFVFSVSHSFVRAFIHLLVCTFCLALSFILFFFHYSIHSLFHSFVTSFFSSFVHTFISSFVPYFVCSFLFVQSVSCAFLRSFVHFFFQLSLIHIFVRSYRSFALLFFFSSVRPFISSFLDFRYLLRSLFFSYSVVYRSFLSFHFSSFFQHVFHLFIQSIDLFIIHSPDLFFFRLFSHTFSNSFVQRLDSTLLLMISFYLTSFPFSLFLFFCSLPIRSSSSCLLTNFHFYFLFVLFSGIVWSLVFIFFLPTHACCRYKCFQ
ncbi:unnamed protein product [Acanthosepion pharaonis]|uniref:Uncharacterized protein n=1 Tax=Acanthosepion pharaonis TaxID=158019 RepID=A0A812DU08_ACAPH|nr:unnamed protein product [Sepia pharaonis]